MAAPGTVTGDPPTAHRPFVAPHHAPRRARRGDAQPFALRGPGHPDPHRPGAFVRRSRIPALLLSTATVTRRRQLSSRELVACSRTLRNVAPRKGVRVDGPSQPPFSRLSVRSPGRGTRVALAAQQPAQRRSLGRRSRAPRLRRADSAERSRSAAHRHRPTDQRRCAAPRTCLGIATSSLIGFRPRPAATAPRASKAAVEGARAGRGVQRLPAGDSQGSGPFHVRGDGRC